MTENLILPRCYTAISRRGSLTPIPKLCYSTALQKNTAKNFGMRWQKLWSAVATRHRFSIGTGNTHRYSATLDPRTEQIRDRRKITTRSAAIESRFSTRKPRLSTLEKSIKLPFQSCATAQHSKKNTALHSHLASRHSHLASRHSHLASSHSHLASSH
jgi:hypothetical protein